MTEEKNSYKGYSLFNDVEDDLLQAWNRSQVVANINQDMGQESAESYVNHFKPEDKMKVQILLAAVSHVGKEEVQKRITATIGSEAV